MITELYSLIGALAWGFDIKRPEGLNGYRNPLPWYENNPYSITMAKQFPVHVTPRSEEKARFIRAGCPEDLSATVRERQDNRLADIDKWAVYTPKDKLYDWEGLTVPLTGFKPPRAYSPGV